MEKTDYMLNLNATVGVKLTPSGMEMLEKEYPVHIEQDENGYHHF